MYCHLVETDASLQAQDQMPPPPSQNVIEPPASHISEPLFDNSHATVESETGKPILESVVHFGHQSFH